MTLPADVLERWERGQKLGPDEAEMVSQFPAIAETLIGRIPRLERVREIIRSYPQPYAPDRPDAAPIEARILRLAVDLDALQVQGLSTKSALHVLTERACYHPDVLRCAREYLDAGDQSTRVVALHTLTPGMVLDQDLRDEQQGMLLVARGHIVSESLLMRLHNLGARPGLPEFVRVLAR